MKTVRLKRSRYVLPMSVAALALTACGDDPTFGPEDSAAVAAPSLAAARPVDLGSCEELAAPTGSTLAFHAYARGFQVYTWNGQGWDFNGPSATLYANEGGTGVVGIHYGGPTWELNSGGLVVGRLNTPCDVAPADIPWLLLDVRRNDGPGALNRVTHIQRLNTVGGRAPAGRGSYAGEVRNVFYTAEYFFYRAP